MLKTKSIKSFRSERVQRFYTQLKITNMLLLCAIIMNKRSSLKFVIKWQNMNLVICHCKLMIIFMSHVLFWAMRNKDTGKYVSLIVYIQAYSSTTSISPSILVPVLPNNLKRSAWIFKKLGINIIPLDATIHLCFPIS